MIRGSAMGLVFAFLMTLFDWSPDEARLALAMLFYIEFCHRTDTRPKCPE